ncbi:MAG: hypothetical protein K0R54_3414 [Clostridiaceae bacterium]|jgi:hypothetical protein|nr:hypothetical protein [Clostridiaceae bacterium]
MEDVDVLNYEKFKSIVIQYYGKQIKYSDFERLLVNIFQKINNSQEKKQVLISMNKEFTFIILLIYLSINEYIENACNSSNNILNNLKSGDKLVKNGKLVVFDKNDDKYIYMLDGNCKVMIPLEKAYTLTKYMGTASRINNYENSKRVTKKIISELLNINEEEFIGDIKKSTLIVFENKEKLYNIIESIEVIHNEKKYKLSEVFPFSYHSSEGNYEFLRGNRIKQNALIKFTTNSSLALDLIREDENISNVIFIGESTYKNFLDTEIRQIEMYDSVNKIILLDTWESTFDFTIFDDEYLMYAFTKSVILDNVNLYGDITKDCDSPLQEYNNLILLNFVNKEINIYEVNDEDIDSNIYDITANLKSLFDYSYDNVQVLDFLKISYSLCNKIEQTLIPLGESKENTYNINKRLDNLINISKIFPENRAEYIVMQEIIELFTNIIKAIKNENEKSNFIMRQYTDKNKYDLFIKNKNELNAVKIYYSKYPSHKFKIKLFDSFKESNSYENLIIPFFIDTKYLNIIGTNKILNLDIIVYKREKFKIDRIVNKTLNMLRYIVKKNKLIDYIEEENELPVINKYYINDDKKDNVELISIEKQVDKLVEENLLNIYLNKAKNGSIEHESSSMNIRKFIMFKDGNYAFLTSNYKANVLDKANNDIIQKELNELNIDDRLIFTINKINGEEDIVKVILKKLLEVKEFSEKYEQYFKLNRFWKDELIKYMEKYNLKEENICEEFRYNSRIINKVTIINWINGNIIGPRDPNDIRIVSKIVNNINLSSQIDKVVEACQYERKIQIHVRKALAKIIVNSVIEADVEENEIQKLIINAIDDIRRYAYIGKIDLIREVTENINIQYINRVIEREG